MLGLGRSLKISRGFSSLAYQSLNRAAQDKSPLFDLARLSCPGILSGLPSEAFRIYPHFLSPEEQSVLLSASLTKLGGKRRRRRDASASVHPRSEQTPGHNLDHIFGSDNDYSFEEGHFDGVIHDYREMTVSAWPDSSPPSLVPILSRLYALIGPVPSNPSLVTPPNVQTHILHLASTGVIIPHVDNVEASGRVIAGVSLGDTRVLRMSREDEGTFDVLLKSGSVYIQRDDVRYQWKHEIPNMAEFQGRKVGGGQRLSVMLRDLYTAPHHRSDAA